MPNALLFIIPTLIWGSTLYVIKFQLGNVDPLVSVAYRFLIAGAILLGYCVLKKHPLKYSFPAHRFLFLNGIFLFGLNYWLVYIANEHIASGLLAVVYSLILFMNVFNGAIFLKAPVRLKVVLGGFLGITGTFFMFKQDLSLFNPDSNTFTALLLAIISVFFVSIGNIISLRNQQNNIPVIPATAWSMIYGSLSMFLIALIQGKEFVIDTSIQYVSSMIFLVVFGSIIAFTFYLTLIGRIGADKAAYGGILVPVIAMVISTIFEGFVWSADSYTGMFLILTGNIVALFKKKDTAVELKKAS